jgi:hypothetical protein
VRIIKLKDLQNEHAQLMGKKKPKAEDMERIKEIESEMVPLKSFLQDAQHQRDQIKAEIGMILNLG